MHRANPIAKVWGPRDGSQLPCDRVQTKHESPLATWCVLYQNIPVHNVLESSKISKI